MLFFLHFNVFDSGDPIGNFHARMHKVMHCAAYNSKVLIFYVEGVFGRAKGYKNRYSIGLLVMHVLAHKHLNTFYLKCLFIPHHIGANVQVSK